MANQPGLEFRLSAELGAFLQDMQRGDAGVNKALASMQTSADRFAGALGQAGKSAKDSAAAFAEIEAAGRAFDQLQAQLDPAVAALRQFEAAQEAASAAVRAGIATQAQANGVIATARVRYEAALGRMGQASDAGASRVERFGGAVEAAGGGAAAFASTVGGGTPALQGFAEAVSGVAFAFGPWGAVIGAAAAALGALYAVTVDADDASDDLTFTLGGLESGVAGLEGVVRDYVAAIKDTGAAQKIASAEIVAETQREFEAKKQLLALEIERQKIDQDRRRAAIKEARAELDRGPDYRAAGAVSGPGPASLYAGSAGLDRERARAEEDFAERADELRPQIQQLEAEAELAQVTLDRAAKAVAQSWDDFVKSVESSDGSGGGSGGGSGANSVDRAAERLRDMGQAAVDSAALMDLTGEAAARYRAELEALAVVAEAMKNATPEQVAELEKLANAYVDAAVAAEQKKEAIKATEAAENAAKLAEERFTRGMNTLISKTISIAQSADSASDAFKKMALQLAEVALQAALLGEGPLADLFGGGGSGASGGSGGGSWLSSLFGGGGSGGSSGGGSWLSSLFGGGSSTASASASSGGGDWLSTAISAASSLFGGGLATGGSVQKGKTYAVNEHRYGGRQVETFVAGANGAILNVAQAKDALAKSAATPQPVASPTVNVAPAPVNVAVLNSEDQLASYLAKDANAQKVAQRLDRFLDKS